VKAVIFEAMKIFRENFHELFLRPLNIEIMAENLYRPSRNCLLTGGIFLFTATVKNGQRNDNSNANISGKSSRTVENLTLSKS